MPQVAFSLLTAKIQMLLSSLDTRKVGTRVHCTAGALPVALVGVSEITALAISPAREMGQGASAPQPPPATGAKPPESDTKQQDDSPDLDGVSTETLLAEVQRRLDCLSKPDKRIILVGTVMVPVRALLLCQAAGHVQRQCVKHNTS